MEHHPIFERFTGYEGARPAGQIVDLTGARFKGEWWGKHDIGALDYVHARYATLNEEYFEWCDLLEAVDAARDTFTMVELGAGYGRWGVRGAKAALQRDLTPYLVFVEAEPQHAAWVKEALALNGLEGAVVEAAIAYDEEAVPFAVDTEEFSAANWYGQARTARLGSETGDTYFGHKLFRSEPYGQILAPTKTLEQVLGGIDIVDFMGADLQGAEREVILNSMPIINERVRRAHIRTHSEEIEKICRKAFTKAGWKKVWDFALKGERDTPYGRCWFGAGVSSWINPGLSTAKSHRAAPSKRSRRIGARLEVQ